MSWKSINDLLGRALIDDSFARKLLADPLRAAREGGFPLTREEQAIMQSLKARDITEFSQILLVHLKDRRPRD